MTQELIFACLASPGRSALEAAMLTSSLREFGGRYRNSRVWVFTPETDPPWPEMERTQLEAAGIELERFSVTEEVLDFPFGAKVLAGAAAEEKARGKSEILIWMDSDSLILSEPRALYLNAGQQLGCRPVDHILIGSPWDAPLEPFWVQIYRDCGVSESGLYPMCTSVDLREIRPYFNAGFLVLRPALQVMKTWAQAFRGLYKAPQYQDFYEDHILYRIFFHQAVLSGVLLAAFDRQEIRLLPPYVNFPLHMHSAYPEAEKPDSLAVLTTARYDLLFEKPGWEVEIPLTDHWRDWLHNQARVQWGRAHQVEVDPG